jgi:hypothetical protein
LPRAFRSEQRTCNDATNRPLRIGVPEQASDGQQDASQVGAIYMAAKKKTAKKSTKKKTAKKGKK